MNVAMQSAQERAETRARPMRHLSAAADRIDYRIRRHIVPGVFGRSAEGPAKSAVALFGSADAASRDIFCAGSTGTGFARAISTAFSRSVVRVGDDARAGAFACERTCAPSGPRY